MGTIVTTIDTSLGVPASYGGGPGANAASIGGMLTAAGIALATSEAFEPCWSPLVPSFPLDDPGNGEAAWEWGMRVGLVLNATSTDTPDTEENVPPLWPRQDGDPVPMLYEWSDSSGLWVAP